MIFIYSFHLIYLYSEMNEMPYFILDNSVLSVIFIISFNWVDLMFSLNNSSCIKSLWLDFVQSSWFLSFTSEFILDLSWLRKLYTVFFGIFYYMLQIYSDFSHTLSPHVRLWLLTQPLIGCFAMLCWASRQVPAFWKVAMVHSNI